jgi:hypothetical protein
VTYEELAKRLKEHGMAENAASIANKLSRGTFAATFFWLCSRQLDARRCVWKICSVGDRRRSSTSFELGLRRYPNPLPSLSRLVG